MVDLQVQSKETVLFYAELETELKKEKKRTDHAGQSEECMGQDR